MSRTLEKLRDALGDALLVRSGRGLVRTARAETILPAARTLLEQAHALLTPPSTFEPKSAHGKVTLALGDDMQALLAGHLLARLRREAPGMDVRVRSLGVQSVTELVRGQIDLVVMPDLRNQYPELMNDEVVFDACYERRFVVVSRTRRKLGLGAFLSAEHVLVAPTGDDTGYVDDALRVTGHTRRVAVTVPSFQSALGLVRKSDLVATLPDDVTRHLAPSLFTQQCPVTTPKFDVGVVWAQRFRRDTRHRWLRTLVKEVVLRLGESTSRSSEGRQRSTL
jgi:DNA-binding transcriptional LysR family regulator